MIFRRLDWDAVQKLAAPGPEKRGAAFFLCHLPQCLRPWCVWPGCHDIGTFYIFLPQRVSLSLSLHHVHPAWTGRSTCSKGWSFLVWLLTWMVSMLGWCLYTCLGSPAWLLVSWWYIVPSLLHFVVRFWDCLFFLLHLRLINYWRVSGTSTYSEFSCHWLVRCKSTHAARLKAFQKYGVLGPV